jgi:amino acid transporter
LEAADQYHPWELADGVAPQPNKGHVIGLAIAALSSITLLHICSRRGGILVNNAFAVVKVLVLLVMIGLGIAKACGRLSSPELPKQLQDFDTNQSFKTERHDVPSYTNSLLYIVYTYSGFEQPFSVSTIRHGSLY